MPRFGLKLGVHEKELAAVAKTLWQEKQFDFLELYVLKNARVDQAEFWNWYDGVLVLHAPHSAGGFNFARSEMAADNAKTLELLDAFREQMNPAMMVFHSGADGDIEETFRQVAALRREYPELHSVMLLENKPRLGLNGEYCLGSSSEEMRKILTETECGFCLDVRHAFAYAAWAGLEWRGIIEDFAALKPRLWHAADGGINSNVDSHNHIGEGTMPWEEIGAFWDENFLVTIECAKTQSEILKDFQQDIHLLRRRTGKL